MSQEKISRRDFVKGLAAGAASIVTLGVLNGLEYSATAKSGGAAPAPLPGDATYIPGTYSASTNGMGVVTVTMTFSESSITDISVDVSNETATIGALHGQEFEDAIMTLQSAEIDSISGATVTSNAVKKAAANCIEQALGIAEPITVSAAAEITADTEWLGDEPAEPDNFAEELSADLVIVGGGLAGISAARTAIEAGASVILFEKSSGVGGRSRDFCALGSKWLEENFPSIPKMDSVKWDLIGHTIKGCMDRSKDEILVRWANLNGEAFDWWISGVDQGKLFLGSEANNKMPETAEYGVVGKVWPLPEYFDPAREFYPCYPGTAQMQPGSLAFIQANFEKILTEGGERFRVFFDTPGERLLKKDGRIVGVIAKSYSGSYYKATASKGVILTTGGFLSNDAMVAHFLPKVYQNGFRAASNENIYSTVNVNGERCNVGDGHKMALWAGAMMQQDGCVMAHHKGGVIGTNPYLLLDLHGKRFMNEDSQGGPLGQRIEELPQMKAFQFFDSHVLEQLPYQPYGHGKVNALTQAEIDAAVESGGCVKGATLEELLSQLELDRETALKSIERYNSLCDAGSDEDFGKTASRMFPLKDGPFYCVPWGKGDTLVTLSGLESDADCHVYNTEYEIIPGLYVAGNTQGNRFAYDYPETSLGMSHAMALTFGRLAAKNALASI